MALIPGQARVELVTATPEDARDASSDVPRLDV